MRFLPPLKPTASKSSLWRVFLENPEPGYREFKTSAKAKEVLSGLGLPLRDHLSITGMRADLDTGRSPNIGSLVKWIPDPAFASRMRPRDRCHSLLRTSLPHHRTARCRHRISGIGAAADLSGKIAFIPVPAEECIEVAERRAMLERGKSRQLAARHR